MEDAVAAVTRELLLACHGEGLTPSWVDRSSGVLQAVIGSSDSEAVVGEVRRHLSQPPIDKYLSAVGSALGLGEAKGESLTERRSSLILSGQISVASDATVRRWEKKGATVLARRLLTSADVSVNVPSRLAGILPGHHDQDSAQESLELMRDIRDELREIHSILAERSGISE
jgi:hypothetical protein